MIIQCPSRPCFNQPGRRPRRLRPCPFKPSLARIPCLPTTRDRSASRSGCLSRLSICPCQQRTGILKFQMISPKVMASPFALRGPILILSRTAQRHLRELKSKISTQSKKNFVLEKDVRYLDSRIALLIQNRMALEEVTPPRHR